MQLLTSSRQSGGERSVSTLLFLIALQVWMVGYWLVAYYIALKVRMAAYYNASESRTYF
jgi:hypothetical protein